MCSSLEVKADFVGSHPHPFAFPFLGLSEVHPQEKPSDFREATNLGSKASLLNRCNVEMLNLLKRNLLSYIYGGKPGFRT